MGFRLEGVVVLFRKEHKENDCESLKPPENSGPKLTFKVKFHDFTFTAIRQIVHQFFHRNEVPTIAKVLQVKVTPTK
ncbi:hypothetical protein evm_003160 [Chilo suppressalis]|nr:hypothetical protein evm_003160 [Chilo suppressalis]